MKMKLVEKQKVLDVLNSLDVIESSGGEDAYVLVVNSEENRKKLHEVGLTNETINKYGDKETFCILSLAFSEKYADDYVDGELIVWDELVTDDLRHRVLAGEGAATDAERLLKVLEPNLFNA